MLACAYLEGDRTISCCIREQFTIQRAVFDLNDLDGLKKENNRSKKGENRGVILFLFL